MSATEINFEVLSEATQSVDYSSQWTYIPTDKITNAQSRRIAYRLNALGSSYFFGKFILRKHRLVSHLHKQHLLDRFECTHLKKVIEFPRDFFKSTCATEIMPMWWALPFTSRDEQLMRRLGYGDEWIRWMQYAHNQDTRTCLVSENITNAAKLGKRISLHYENNSLFLAVFPEIKPDTSCTWSSFTYTHKRSPNAAPQGEGTFDLLGVDSALQSRHYDRMVQDDLVGREAYRSQKVMEATIEYHKLLIGAFDSDPLNLGSDNDELVIGNRWSYWDLNDYIRKNEPWFQFETHSATGGCCIYHPHDEVIFPEEWTTAKLERQHKRLGTYLYSCHYLNRPTLPGQTKFKEEWLGYYKFETVSQEDMRVQIVHEVKNGVVNKPTMPGNFDSIILFIDPNHAEDEGRCNHAIVVIGWMQKIRRIYLLEAWAEASSYDILTEEVCKYVAKWKLKEIFLEDNAAQRLLRYPLNTRLTQYQKNGKIVRVPKINPVPADRSKGAKVARIDALDSVFNGTDAEFWIRRIGHEKFIEEYGKYPHAGTKDVLDALALALGQITTGMSRDDVDLFLKKQLDKWTSRRAHVTGY